jgi:hypothetical protein
VGRGDDAARMVLRLKLRDTAAVLMFTSVVGSVDVLSVGSLSGPLIATESEYSRWVLSSTVTRYAAMNQINPL